MKKYLEIRNPPIIWDRPPNPDDIFHPDKEKYMFYNPDLETGILWIDKNTNKMYILIGIQDETFKEPEHAEWIDIDDILRLRKP